MNSNQNDTSRLQNPPEPISPSENATGLRNFLKKYYQQIIGFVGWYVVNILAWVLLTGGKPGDRLGEGLLAIIIIFPVNLLALIILAAIKSTRKIAQGILLALALNFLISLVMGAFWSGLCFIPFIFPTN